MTDRPNPVIRRVLERLARLALRVGLASLVGCARPLGEKPYGVAGKPLVFAILSAENQQSMAPVWAPLLADLTRGTGLVVEPHFASNYSNLIEGMRFNQIQLGWYSALPALEAARRAHGEVIVRVLNQAGTPDYESVVLAGANSSLDLAAVLRCDRRLSFGLGDAKSTSGTLAPMAFLFGPRGIDPKTCFKSVRSASHQANLFAVANGVLDAATGNTVGMIWAKRDNPAVAKRVKVIWTSPPLPESAIVVRDGAVDAPTTEKLRAFFVAYGRGAGPQAEHERAVLAKLSYSGFRVADNGYLLPVRQLEAGVAVVDATRTHDARRIAAAKAQADALAGPNPPPITPMSGS